MKKQFQSNGTSRMPRVWQLLMTMVFLFTFAIGNVRAAGTAIASLSFDNPSTLPSAYTYSSTNTPAIAEVDSKNCVNVASGGGSTAPTFSADNTSAPTGGKRWVAFQPDANCTVTFKVRAANNGRIFYLLDKDHSSTSDAVSSFTATAKNTWYDTWSVDLTAGTWYAIIGSGSNCYITSMQFAAKVTTKHSVTYALNGGTGTAPTQADVAEGATFTVASGTTGITAPTNKKFYKWYDGTNYYAAGDTYTMGTSNVTLTAQWVDDLPDPTATFANATYILGSSSLNMASKFSSNSTGAVTYALKEATANASITEAGVFTATAEGEYVVVANQAAVSGTYAAISKEATVTVLDNEISDTYVWKKGSGYTGCVSSPNADAPTAKYTTVTVEGMAAMTSGRASTANTTVTVTITATQEGFAIKNICTYGKLEESEGAEISWDGGTNWTSLAAYSETKKDFAAPAGFPTSFKIKFVSASTSSGGLWWRNALVTLEVIKTVSGTTEALQDVKVNGTSIAAADLATLKADKSLAIATTYAAAPTVTFVKRTTTNYEGGWPASVVDTEEEVTATDATANWSASKTINAQAYTVTLAKPAGPSLETEATGISLASAKIATDEKVFTFSGANLEGKVTIALESAVSGMTITPAEVTPTAGAITDQEVTITYKSLENVAEANVNLIVRYNDDVKLTIPVTYSSTAGVEALTPISAATTWNWDGAADAAFGTLGQNEMIVLANADVTWAASFNALAIAGKLQHYYRDSKYAQGDELKFNTTIPGKVYVTYSNTGGNAARTVNVNGTKGSLQTAGTGEKRTEAFSVAAGDVLIKGVQVSDDAAKMLRYYQVEFKPVYSVTYNEGEGSIKSGEAIPTHPDEAAGEKITLAAATVLEKDGYDFTGWLCSVDGLTYAAGAEYTMTAAATTFTAQWTVHIDPVDPTLTYDDGAYTTGLAALDLSTLITTSESTGAITYSVKEANGTGATIDGNNFTATAAGTAVITASQAAVVGFNAKSVDFNVVVTEPTEVDGIKLVVNNALTGNFRVKADQLKTGAYTVEGINYAKYVQMGSTHTSFSGETEGNQTKGIYFAPTKKNIKFWFYMRNTDSSARKIYIYKMEEGSSVASATVTVEPGSQLVSYDMTLSTNAEVIFGVENTKLYFCQIVAVESGDALLQGGEAGYVFDYSKKRQNVAKETLRTIDGIDYYLYAESKINSASNVQLQTLGTHYIKFHLDAPKQVSVYADNKKYYIGSECSTEDAAKLYEATGDGEFTLAAGDWYINGSGAQVKISKLEFALPKCEKPTVADLADVELCAGEPYTELTVSATKSDEGTLHYAWFKESGETDEAVGTDAATYTPAADGEYYVIVTNTLAGHQDNAATSNTISVAHFASVAITTAPEDVYKHSGLDAELSVVATGKNLTYEWFTCDNELGTNPVAFVPAETGTSLLIENIEAGIKYYQVVVTDECGSSASAVAKVEAFDDLPQVDVTETTTWDMANVSANAINLKDDYTPSKQNERLLLANIDGVNNATFNAQALMFEGQHIGRTSNSVKHLAGQYVQFNVTVPGMVSVTFASNGSSQRTIQINGKLCSRTTDDGTYITYNVAVEPGSVVIEDVQGYVRISKIEFKAEADYQRTVNPSYLGTLCWTNNAVLGGATLYEFAGKNENNYLVFDEVAENRLEAGKPYIFMPENGNTQIKVYNTDNEPALTEDQEPVNNMYGTITGKTLTQGADDNMYYFSANHIWAVKDFTVEIPIPAYCCYVDYPAVLAGEPAAAPAQGRRRVTMGVQGTQVATGFENINATDKPMKIMINGQMFILRGEKMFDATGRLVK